jgi:hypothetical protein
MRQTHRDRRGSSLPRRTRTAVLAVLAAAGLAAPPAAAASESPPEPIAAAASDGAFPETAAETGTVIAPRPRPAPSPEARASAAQLFAMPAITDATRAALAALAAGNLAEANRLLDAQIARFPGVGELRANRAVLAMLDGDPAAAGAHLEAALRSGGVTLAEIADDPMLAPLVDDPETGPRLAAAAANAGAVQAAPAPAPVIGGRAPVSAANTAWNPETERLQPRFAFADAPGAPILPERPKSAALDILRDHAKAGRAAGNHGDLYDNRDRGHSTLKPAAHPQLAHVIYDAAARAAGVDYGLAGPFLFDRPTFGNSSTAFTGGPYWRSQPRHALTHPDGTGPMRLWQAARANHLYVYPAHKDFTDERGDLFPANTPYILVSRGSSGSDRPFLEALALIFAAFRPETKQALVDAHLLVPTVQMVFRRSLQNVRSRESYLSGDAHPAVFDGYQINLARMVSLANSITPGAIPAEARVRVVEEDLGVEGVDYFGQGLSEQLFDTPQAIARIWRSKAGRRTMLLSAEDSRDANGRDLTYHWRLLQGDPDKVTIEPLDGGRRARITLDWHEPFEISEDVPLQSARVDIGLFVNNGAHDSAPAIVSWYFPPGAQRRYEPGPDGAPRIAAIDHTAAAAENAPYADPLLIPQADWRDTFHYAADGSPAGWTRTRGGTAQAFPEAFTADGRRILDRGPDGSPLSSQAVAHVLHERPQGGFAIDEITPLPGQP